MILIKMRVRDDVLSTFIFRWGQNNVASKHIQWDMKWGRSSSIYAWFSHPNILQSKDVVNMLYLIWLSISSSLLSVCLNSEIHWVPLGFGVVICLSSFYHLQECNTMGRLLAIITLSFPLPFTLQWPLISSVSESHYARKTLSSHFLWLRVNCLNDPTSSVLFNIE